MKHKTKEEDGRNGTTSLEIHTSTVTPFPLAPCKLLATQEVFGEAASMYALALSTRYYTSCLQPKKSLEKRHRCMRSIRYHTSCLQPKKSLEKRHLCTTSYCFQRYAHWQSRLPSRYLVEPEHRRVAHTVQIDLYGGIDARCLR